MKTSVESEPDEAAIVYNEAVIEAESVDMQYWEHPEDCCSPIIWRLLSPFFRGLLDSKVGHCWNRLRQSCYCIVENRYFEGFIFTMIIISSGTLVGIEDFFIQTVPLGPGRQEFTFTTNPEVGT